MATPRGSIEPWRFARIPGPRGQESRPGCSRGILVALGTDALLATGERLLSRRGLKGLAERAKQEIEAVDD